MKLTLNDMLRADNLDPTTVMVFRHRPKEAKLNRVLPWLALQKPYLYNAYQQSQGEKLENAYKSAKYVASFIGREAGLALYIGLYQVRGWEELTRAQHEQRAETQELYRWGMRGFSADDQRQTVLWFDLAKTPFYSDWMGRLVVTWPGKELSWWRWAHRNDFELHAVHEESVLEASMPEWTALKLSWEELGVIPRRWQVALQEWRGIYYIFDTLDGKGYVGSAYGETNILGRWLNYAATGHGGNQLLKKRNPQTFRFTILQRVSPDLPADEVIRVESTWKDRLHSREPYGLNDN